MRAMKGEWCMMGRRWDRHLRLLLGGRRGRGIGVGGIPWGFLLEGEVGSVDRMGRMEVEFLVGDIIGFGTGLY